jgi:hypothetical protein
MEVLGDQVGFAVVTSYLLERLKRAPWFTILTPESSASVKRWFSILAAIVTTVGVHYAFDPDARQIVIQLPDWDQALHGLADVVKQFAFQQAAYATTIKGRV